MRRPFLRDVHRFLPVPRLAHVKAERHQQFDKQRPVIRLIIRDEQAITRLPRLKSNRVARSVARRLNHLRQTDMNRKSNGRASIERAADVNVPAHQFHELPAERQAQARAFLRLPPAFGLHERLKEQRQFFRRNPAPGIFDFERKDMRLRVARQTPHAHGDAARVGEFHRVIQQVEQYLPQFHRVRADILRHVVGVVHAQN